MLGLDVNAGKVYPRQLSEKEIKEAEELAAQKGKKKTPKKSWSKRSLLKKRRSSRKNLQLNKKRKESDRKSGTS